MRPVFLSLSPSAEDTDYFANDLAITTTAPALTNTSTPDGLAHQVAIVNNSTANSLAAITFTITAKDQDGITRTEALTGPIASATVESTGYYVEDIALTLSAVSTAATVDFGFVDEVSSPTIAFDTYADGGGASLIFNLEASTAAAIDYTAQYTGDDIQRSTSSISWHNHDDSNLVNATASVSGNYEFIPIAHRVILNSYSSAPILKHTIIDNGR